nr:hypothetical protein Q903MT_gene5084 [Picea sitchensis]
MQSHVSIRTSLSAINRMSLPLLWLTWFLTDLNARYCSQPCPSTVNESHSLVKAFPPRIH